MEAKYFNTWEFEQASADVKINPLRAKLRFEEYIKKYPKDYQAYPYYIYTLIILGESDKAAEIVEYAETLGNNDSHFFNEKDKLKDFKQRITLIKLRVLAIQEKYDELYQYCLENLNQRQFDDMYTVIMYCKKKMGILVADRDVNTYTLRQIIEYQESDFLDHIQKHLFDYNVAVDEPNTSIFAADFPIIEVIEEIKRHIPSSKKLCTGYFTDKYVFKYDRCGRHKNKPQDYFIVPCFHNTHNLISIYPAPHCEELPYVDLNYLKQSNEPPKIKTMSQIDKFNQRYLKLRQKRKNDQKSSFFYF